MRNHSRTRRSTAVFVAAIAAALAATFGLTSCSSTGAGSTTSVVRIAAASDLVFALPELQELVQKEHPEIDMRITYGSSGQFVQQISNGAPFDLYLSADVQYARDLIDAGLAREDALFIYALGRLAVWTTREDLTMPLDVAALAQPGIAKVAIANPRHAPYGRAAISALDRAGVLAAVEPRLVLGENVAQAAEFVATGAADAGIVALSLLFSGALSDQGTWREVPIDEHDRIEQGGVVLTNAIDTEAAAAVGTVMQSPAGKEILRSYGFYEEG